MKRRNRATKPRYEQATVASGDRRRQILQGAAAECRRPSARLAGYRIQPANCVGSPTVASSRLDLPAGLDWAVRVGNDEAGQCAARRNFPDMCIRHCLRFAQLSLRRATIRSSFPVPSLDHVSTYPDWPGAALRSERSLLCQRSRSSQAVEIERAATGNVASDTFERRRDDPMNEE